MWMRILYGGQKNWPSNQMLDVFRSMCCYDTPWLRACDGRAWTHEVKKNGVKNRWMFNMCTNKNSVFDPVLWHSLQIVKWWNHRKKNNTHIPWNFIFCGGAGAWKKIVDVYKLYIWYKHYRYPYRKVNPLEGSPFLKKTACSQNSWPVCTKFHLRYCLQDGIIESCWLLHWNQWADYRKMSWSQVVVEVGKKKGTKSG